VAVKQTPEPNAASFEVFSALVAHELRTPVAAFLGYLELLQDEQVVSNPARLRDGLAIAHQRATQLGLIVSRLSDFASRSAGGAALMRPPGVVTLGDVLEEVATREAVAVEASAEALQSAVDADRLRIVLSELVDNAGRFGQVGGMVSLRAGVEGEPPRLVLRVVNEGDPIPDELRAAVFEPFRQGEDYLTRHHGGLGLGLTMARRAAESAGGTLLLEPGQPTTFQIALPLRSDALTREAQQLDRRAAHAEAQALLALQSVRHLRADNERERQAREQAVKEQLRAVDDFRAANRHALELAGRLDSAYLEIITALAKAVEVRDEYTGSHVERVCHYTMKIAEALKMSAETLRPLEFGAVLHDVGKIGVPDTILGKPAPLDDQEWQVMRRHPEIGRGVLEGISFLAPALDAVACHHERWDGRGYPRQLAGDEIPLAGRIVAVADAFDAMTTDRPYRKGLPVDEALAELERGKGKSFDPQIVEAFVASQRG
jgi:HD-GYP domain-containing protein (c-di-GMP phosphodiesterase class II)/anti-sigma regulatory factor (Ser/Thr protein kinase)